jgi:hypothetical protein
MVNNRSRTGGVRSMYRWAGVIDVKTHVGVACAGRSMAPHEAAVYGGLVGKYRTSCVVQAGELIGKELFCLGLVVTRGRQCLRSSTRQCSTRRAGGT